MLLSTALALGCGVEPLLTAFPALSRPGEIGATVAGHFDLLSYNVAGLLEPISASHPAHNHPLIGPLLNDFAVALVQEDFHYHRELAAAVTLPYASSPANGVWWQTGDGLNRFARFAPADHARHTWTHCHGHLSDGSDCLAAKGFAVSQTELAPGVFVDIYNLHMDAGSSAGDRAARDAQVDQLLATLRERSTGRAVVVAGDTNLRRARAGDGAVLDRLLRRGGLIDACAAVDCGDDRIDRVLLRGSATLELQVLDWRIAADFIDENGAPLSDHAPIAVTLGWRWR